MTISPTTVRVCVTSALVLALGVGLAWADDWGAVRSKAEDFHHKADALEKRAPEATRKIVTAICRASSRDERKSAASSAASDARSEIDDPFDDLQHVEREVVESLDHVIDDEHQSDQHGEAESMKSAIQSRFEQLDERTRSLRNENHPVIEWMLSHGEEAIHDRMDRCDAKDVALDGGHAACLMASGETCTVIELSPDGSSAVGSARDRARRYQSELEGELKKADSNVLKHLIREHGDFARCKRFEAKVDCFRQCPEIGDDNRFREVSPSWHTDC